MVITESHIQKAVSYDTYRKIIDELVSKNEKFQGEKGARLHEYYLLNISRMNKWDKIFTLEEETIQKLKSIPFKVYWVVITEGWCGDSAQIAPILAKMEEQSENIELKFLFRDENPEVMNAYLTNGSKSIPKLVCLRASTLEELGTWGPRPEETSPFLKEYKSGAIDQTAFIAKIHAWYAKDKGRAIQEEIIKMMERIK